jgi:hypothetical protein
MKSINHKGTQRVVTKGHKGKSKSILLENTEYHGVATGLFLPHSLSPIKKLELQY